MKSAGKRLRSAGHDSERGWPGYLLGGHVRTSTVILITALIAVWWVYLAYQHTGESGPNEAPTQVVPPGFVPDPNYTWVPRARLEQPPATVTETMAPQTVTVTPPPAPEPAPGAPEPAPGAPGQTPESETPPPRP
jgi:hypothetical protein